MGISISTSKQALNSELNEYAHSNAYCDANVCGPDECRGRNGIDDIRVYARILWGCCCSHGGGQVDVSAVYRRRRRRTDSINRNSIYGISLFDVLFKQKIVPCTQECRYAEIFRLEG